ncbi:hypothetical protein AVEN_151844-1 [Araneus ventricosus]|uniref:Uncharacterized protein n=1 Tax=Araneus ventricosus TaxID=182803 RepID=A0A4Y2NBU8_ARAVE|nr:hypothetical protein AVEN_151844-1 [Araneus ventricosus]
MTIQDARISPWIITMDSSPGPGARCPAIKKKDKPMDSKIQVKKHQSPEEPGVNNLERKRQKRKSSRLNVFIYSAGGKFSSCHKLVLNYKEPGTTNIGSMVVRVEVRIV